MDYNYNGILLSDEQIDRYYNELKDFGAFNIPIQISNNLSLIDNNLDYINDEFSSMNSNRIEAEKEEIIKIKAKIREDEEHINNFIDKSTKRIEELKHMLQEFEILKPNVVGQSNDYKTRASNEDTARLEELRVKISSKIDEIKNLSQGNVVYNMSEKVRIQVNQNDKREEKISTDNIDQIGFSKDN